MNKIQHHFFAVSMTVLFLLSFALIGNKAAILTGGSGLFKEKKNQYEVVLDAGHGGMDPGKVGVNNVLEKDINLAITLQLKNFLEAADVKVILTRTDDNGLYKESDKNKKVQDMKSRLAILNQKAPDLAVSIHQNSYPQEKVNGAQVFFYKESLEGKNAATMMQQQLIKGIEPENHREAKPNDTYYLLKKTECPLIIVECGFLSNYNEAEKLADTAYQEKLAWNMHLAIMQYLNQLK